MFLSIGLTKYKIITMILPHKQPKHSPFFCSCKNKNPLVILMSAYQHPYAQSGVVLDCLRPATGYNQPSYSLAPRCGSVQPDCDNLSYSAFATDSSYNGYYDSCQNSVTPSAYCDLQYVNASPKTVIGCWKGCCPSEGGCDKNCHVQCVTNQSKKMKA